MTLFVEKELPNVTEVEWKAFIEKLKPHYRKEHEEIAKLIPCDDAGLCMAMAMVPVYTPASMDDPDLLIRNMTTREALKTKEGIECYKHAIFYLKQPETYYLPKKIGKSEFEKVPEDQWRRFIEMLKPYFREEYQEIAKQIPCEDEELRMAMAMVVRNICKSLNNPVPWLGNVIMKDVLKTKEGIEFYKRLAVDYRYPNLYWLTPSGKVIK